MNLDLKSLLHFVVVAEEMSVTRAAKRLGIAQPWLSQRIKALETRLGFDLFVRQSKRLTLSEKGEALFEAARGLPVLARKIAETADRLSEDVRGSLRIGAPPYAHRIPIVNDLLGEIGAGYREANITLEVGWSSHLVSRVRQGDLDAAFALEPFDHADLDVFEVERLSRLFVLPGRSGENADMVTADELRNRAVAVFPRDVNPGLFDLAFQPLIDAGVNLVPVAFDGRPMRRDIPPGTVVQSYFGIPDPAQPAARRLAGSPAISFSFVTRMDHRPPLVRAALGRLREAVLSSR